MPRRAAELVCIDAVTVMSLMYHCLRRLLVVVHARAVATQGMLDQSPAEGRGVAGLLLRLCSTRTVCVRRKRGGPLAVGAAASATAVAVTSLFACRVGRAARPTRRAGEAGNAHSRHGVSRPLERAAHRGDCIMLPVHHLRALPVCGASAAHPLRTALQHPPLTRNAWSQVLLQSCVRGKPVIPAQWQEQLERRFWSGGVALFVVRTRGARSCGARVAWVPTPRARAGHDRHERGHLRVVEGTR